ncbi:MAG: GyrI-like domain-containing protein [Dehalococcoidia bacterium]
MTASEFKIEKRQPIHAAIVRGSALKADLSTAFAVSFGKVFSTLATQGVAPISMPFVRYPAMGDTVAFEAGAMVADPFKGANDVVGIEFAGGDVATAIHAGPYEDLPATHEALIAWLGQQGRHASGPPWEEYIDDPGQVSDPANVRTRVSYPLS